MRSRSHWRSLAASLAWLGHGDAAFEPKASALATASLLATPYGLDYDLVVLAISIALLARHSFKCGFRDYEINVLAVAWIVPLISRGLAGATGIPLGLIVMLALYVATLQRAITDREFDGSRNRYCGRTAHRASVISISGVR